MDLDSGLDSVQNFRHAHFRALSLGLGFTTNSAKFRHAGGNLKYRSPVPERAFLPPKMSGPKRGMWSPQRRTPNSLYPETERAKARE